MPVQLSPSQQQRWEEYNRLENSGTRVDRVPALDAFIEELLRSPKSLWKQWAMELAAQLVDDGKHIPVRRSLFERVLFPALLEGLDEKSAGCARWLAGLEAHLHRCPDCVRRLGPERASRRELLREALAIDPGDQKVRRQLIRIFTDDFSFALHELPAGVVLGLDGPALSECDKLIAELEEFRAMITAEGSSAERDEFIAKCDYHFRAYKRYLMDPSRYRSYAEFLAQDRAPREQ